MGRAWRPFSRRGKANTFEEEVVDRLKDRVAFVTGASRGIGRAMARALRPGRRQGLPWRISTLPVLETTAGELRAEGLEVIAIGA